MSYRWIVFGLTIATVGGGAWILGRPSLPPVTPGQKAVRVAPPTLQERPADKPATPVRVVEVIDLSRAYEPVRNIDPMDGIETVAYLTDPSVPARIPPAADDDAFRDVRVTVAAAVTGGFLPGVEGLQGERIDIQPREVAPRPAAEATPEPLDVMPRFVRPYRFEANGILWGDQRVLYAEQLEGAVGP